MNQSIAQLSQFARASAGRREWGKVLALADKIIMLKKENAEGYFLKGLAQKHLGDNENATRLFLHALKCEQGRYDAAVELANQYVIATQYSEACSLLIEYQDLMSGSSFYLNMAAMLYTSLGLHERAWGLYKKAIELQPEADSIRANMAACAVLVGNIADAKKMYSELSGKYPTNQKNHYELSRLAKAEDFKHVDFMEGLLRSQNLPDEKNIYLYYGIGKELEDLGQWKKSFDYYSKAGEAILQKSNYNVDDDIRVIDRIIERCDKHWLDDGGENLAGVFADKTPIFIVGLPRTGTTLTERIISSHSLVESADETFFMQVALRKASGEKGFQEATESTIENASKQDITQIAKNYQSLIEYRLHDKPYFIDKYPLNYLYLGFIAKAFPNAKIIYQRRNPMDTCFALFKQSFFKFAYSLDDLAKYYIAQERLRKHWLDCFGERTIEVQYDSLVADQLGQTRRILAEIGLSFENACVEFEKNPHSSATASAVQVREKIHTDSVNKWKFFADELSTLKEALENAEVEMW